MPFLSIVGAETVLPTRCHGAISMETVAEFITLFKPSIEQIHQDVDLDLDLYVYIDADSGVTRR